VHLLRPEQQNVTRSCVASSTAASISPRCLEITDVLDSGIQMLLLFSRRRTRKNYLRTCGRLDMAVLGQCIM